MKASTAEHALREQRPEQQMLPQRLRSLHGKEEEKRLAILRRHPLQFAQVGSVAQMKMSGNGKMPCEPRVDCQA